MKNKSLLLVASMLAMSAPSMGGRSSNRALYSALPSESEKKSAVELGEEMKRKAELKRLRKAAKRAKKG